MTSEAEMTLRTVTVRPTGPAPAPAAPARGGRPDDAVRTLDRALDEALEHIGGLAERLWAVRRLHTPVRVRTLRGTRVQCAGCGHASPCPTALAASPAAA